METRQGTAPRPGRTSPGRATTGIALYVDRRLVSRDRRAPFTLRWNSRAARTDGTASRLPPSRSTAASRAARCRSSCRTTSRPARDCSRTDAPRTEAEAVQPKLRVAHRLETIADGSTVTRHGRLERAHDRPGGARRLRRRRRRRSRPRAASRGKRRWDTSTQRPGHARADGRCATTLDGRTARNELARDRDGSPPRHHDDDLA